MWWTNWLSTIRNFCIPTCIFYFRDGTCIKVWLTSKSANLVLIAVKFATTKKFCIDFFAKWVVSATFTVDTAVLQNDCHSEVDNSIQYDRSVTRLWYNYCTTSSIQIIPFVFTRQLRFHYNVIIVINQDVRGWNKLFLRKEQGCHEDLRRFWRFLDSPHPQGKISFYWNKMTYVCTSMLICNDIANIMTYLRHLVLIGLDNASPAKDT